MIYYIICGIFTYIFIATLIYSIINKLYNWILIDEKYKNKYYNNIMSNIDYLTPIDIFNDNKELYESPRIDEFNLFVAVYIWPFYIAYLIIILTILACSLVSNIIINRLIFDSILRLVDKNRFYKIKNDGWHKWEECKPNSEGYIVIGLISEKRHCKFDYYVVRYNPETKLNGDIENNKYRLDYYNSREIIIWKKINII